MRSGVSRADAAAARSAVVAAQFINIKMKNYGLRKTQYIPGAEHTGKKKTRGMQTTPPHRSCEGKKKPRMPRRLIP